METAGEAAPLLQHSRMGLAVTMPAMHHKRRKLHTMQ